MFRLMGNILPDNKSIWIALTNIYGIGRPKSRTILDGLKINFMTKVKDLTDEDEKMITDLLKDMVIF